MTWLRWFFDTPIDDLMHVAPEPRNDDFEPIPEHAEDVTRPIRPVVVTARSYADLDIGALANETVAPDERGNVEAG